MLYNGFVYLAKSDTGHYKIGMSKNPFGRVKHFKTQMPVNVKLIHFFPCDNPRRVEGMLHEWFSEYRYKGEWFNLPEEAVNGFLTTTHAHGGNLYQLVELSKNGKGYDYSLCCYEYLEKTIVKGEAMSPDGHYYVFIKTKNAEQLEEARNAKRSIEKPGTLITLTPNLETGFTKVTISDNDNGN